MTVSAVFTLVLFPSLLRMTAGKRNKTIKNIISISEVVSQEELRISNR